MQFAFAKTFVGDLTRRLAGCWLQNWAKSKAKQNKAKDNDNNFA